MTTEPAPDAAAEEPENAGAGTPDGRPAVAAPNGADNGAGDAGPSAPPAGERVAVGATVPAPETREPRGPQRPRGQEYEHRSLLLGELHARPFESVQVPHHFFHYAYLTDGDEKRAARAAIQSLMEARGGAAMSPGESFSRFHIGQWDLRWEQHTEFTTFRWGHPLEGGPFAMPSPDLSFDPPGRLTVATRLSITDQPVDEEQLARMFDPSSVCVVDVEDGAAQVITDFQVDPSGHTRILILDRGDLGAERAGSLVQRALEIETYRTLTLMGLPTARATAPKVRRIEQELSDLTRAISEADAASEYQKLLPRLTALAAELEAEAADNAFRFGASRAYHDIVRDRLAAIGETKVTPYRTISAFFSRRLTPAIATCNALEKRQETLSQKLARTAELLRTQMQFELEQQNRDLLQSMNRRSRLQLRLQQTVEGLSVVAISYYAIGLLGYLYKGLASKGFIPASVSADLLTGLSVVPVVLAIWYLLRRVRRSLHGTDDDDNG